jgi:hypothetical protein
MKDQVMSRKNFLTGIGKACACSCAGAMSSTLYSAAAQSTAGPNEKRAESALVKKPRSQERIEFAEKWVQRFFIVLDTNLDEPVRRNILMANGKACFLAWQKETNREPRTEAITLERFAQRVNGQTSSGYKVEGNVIHFQYSKAAETGQSAPENHCLCPMVESKPAGLSPTFCLCSLGYVKEMHEQLFKKNVEVALVSSVLRGDARCRFRITVV